MHVSCAAIRKMAAVTTWRLFMSTELNTVFSRQIKKAESLRYFLQVFRRKAVHSSSRDFLCQQSTPPQPDDHYQPDQQSKKSSTREERQESLPTNKEHLARNYLPVLRDPDSAPKTIPRGQTISLGYETKPFWEGYVRKFKGAIPPRKTRKRCSRGKDKLCGNPCPICRDRIRVHFKSTEILKQFICPYSGKILEPKTTGLCRQQQRRVVESIERARRHGYLPYVIPRRLPKKERRIPPWNKIDVR